MQSMRVRLPNVLLASIAAIALAGCGSSGGDKTASNSSDSNGAPPVDMSKAIAGTDKPTGDLDVAAFKGGYGIDFYQQAATDFQTKNPGLKITVWGDPRVWEELKPKFVAGTPPDLVFPGWGFDHWLAVTESQIMPLDKAMASPSYDGKGTWGNSFEPALLKLGQQDGHQYVLPYYFNVMGWWYDPGVFQANGWTVPQNFDDLLALCAKIKAKGIAPITFQGKYPYYMVEGMLYPWISSVGGIQALNDCQNLVPGAWKSPAVLKAAQMIKQLQDAGYLEQGATGMSHTESQTEFLKGRAAMIPCGTWLYSEMSKNFPNAKMEFLLPPVVKDGKGDPTALLIGIEPWMVPMEGKNPNGAIQLFKYMTSLDEAKKFVQQKGTLMAIKGSSETALPAVLKTPSKVFEASKTVYANQLRYWYPALQTEMENSLTALLTGDATPEQFCDRVEAAAQKVREDDSVPKHKLGS
jgi:N-acetylglucosamine transport system substrate-binding protein